MSGIPAVTPEMRPCGEDAWLLDIGDNGLVHRWAEAIRRAALPGVWEVVPGLTTLLVAIDSATTTAAELRSAIRTMSPAAGDGGDHAHHVIDVRYDGEDLAEVARLTGLSTAEVVAAHTESQWRVAFCGFAPGFAYLVGGDARLHVPRRDEARVRVPAGAVAIAGEFASIYPRTSPGGWQLLGRTEAVLWDIAADPPALLSPGALVRFRDVDR